MDRMVFGKLYFDAAGMIIAAKEGTPVGFSHCGFGPNADNSDLDYSIGMINQVRILPTEDAGSIGPELISRSLNYLKSKNAKTCFAGSRFPWSPFYLGLYGGSRVPGVADEDPEMLQAFSDYGFEKKQSVNVVQLRLSGFRPPVDRKQMQIRRQFSVTPIVDPKPLSWWDSCTFGWHEIFGFWLVDKKTQEEKGRVSFWEIQPLSTEWGTRTMGLCDLRIDEQHRRQGLATFLLGEAFRQLATQAVSIVELQFLEGDQPMDGLSKKLGFEKIHGGSILELNIA